MEHIKFVHKYLPLIKNTILEDIIFINTTGISGNIARNFKL
jgi:hypothetical protein